MDYRVHGILQIRILEWVAIPFSRGSSQPRDRTQISLIAGRFFTSWATISFQKFWPRNFSNADCLIFSFISYIGYLLYSIYFLYFLYNLSFISSLWINLDTIGLFSGLLILLSAMFSLILNESAIQYLILGTEFPFVNFFNAFEVSAEILHTTLNFEYINHNYFKFPVW